MQVMGYTVRLFALVIFIVLYMCLGALLFSYLEAPREEEWRLELNALRLNFLLNNTCVSDGELEAFIVEIIEANNRGVSAVRNVSGEPNWSFGQSLFFAGTILTTIGYGHVTPLSEGGKVFSIVYATIGIPLTLIMFTALVERLMILTTRMLHSLQTRLGPSYTPLHVRMIHLSILISLVVIFVFAIPSALFTLLETSWNYLDSFYYCFISLTTIGLGDYIPGDDPDQKQRPLYKIATTFYLFIGLVCMMLTLANIYDIPELNIGTHFYMHGEGEEEENTTTVTARGERSHLRDGDSGHARYSEQVNKGYQNSIQDDPETDS